MIKSMTGFGRGEASAGPLRATVEIRSVNHRFADLKIRLSSDLSELEIPLHKRLKESIHRGRLDVNVTLSRSGNGARPVEVDRGLVDAYVRAAKHLKREFGLSGGLSIETVLGLPDVVRPRVRSGEVGRQERTVVFRAVDNALASHAAMREREGGLLAKDLSRRLARIAKLRERIEKRAPGMLPDYGMRLKRRLDDLNGAVTGHAGRFDETRVAQEIAIVVERSDITEEVVRLAGHVEQAREVMKSADGPVGKKIDFLLQEMNREANTINSKAIDLEICRDALEIKAEVEKIREQVQNIE